MNYKNKWSIQLALGLSGALVLGSVNLSDISSVATAKTVENVSEKPERESALLKEHYKINGLRQITIPDDYYDEVVSDDSDLQLDDEVGEDNPTWEDYEQELQDQNQAEKEPEVEDSDDIEIPEEGYYFWDVEATYVVTCSDFINGTVEYKAPVGGVTVVDIPSEVNISGIEFKVTSIADKAFKNYKALTKVSGGRNITKIGEEAFLGCTKLKSVTLGSKISKIKAQAFYNCKSLTQITIPAKVNKIGKQAFAGCTKLKNINIKTKSLTDKNLGSGVFKNISKKAVIKVPKGKLKTYQKLFKKKGLSATVKVKVSN